MRKLATILIFVLMLSCFLTRRAEETTYNTDTKQNSHITISSVTHQEETIRRVAENTIFIVVFVVKFTELFISKRKLVVENVIYIWHKNKHIKHLPRANILNLGIII